MDASSAHTAREPQEDISFEHCTVREIVQFHIRNDISYGSIAPPVTYVLFAAFIILMKAATVYAMRGLKQAK